MMRLKRMLGLSIGTFAVVVMATASIASSNQDADEAQEAILGSWKGDREKTIKVLKEAGAEQGEIDRVVGEIENITLTFKEDKSFDFVMAVGGDSEKLQGTWEIGDMDDESFVMILNVEEFGEAQEMTFTILDMGTFVQIVPEEESPAIFKKLDD